MKYNITDESITLFEGSRSKIINLDEKIIQFEQDILKWILVEKLDFDTICKKLTVY